jgi:hypothetical protein
MYILTIQLSFLLLVSLALAEWYRSLNHPYRGCCLSVFGPSRSLPKQHYTSSLSHIPQIRYQRQFFGISTRPFDYHLYQRQAPRGKKVMCTFLGGLLLSVLVLLSVFGWVV